MRTSRPGPKSTIPIPARVRTWLGPAVIALTCVVMLIWTWGKWADVFIDFGRELYVPWQITTGKVLYRDLAYLNGPLSPYTNALWFSLFGVSFRTLAICNILLIGVLLVLLYRLLSAIGSRLSASVACVVFALLFGFGTQRITGNYNNVCPYSHELTHGILLGLASIQLLALFGRNKKSLCLAGSGFLVGLAFLTKPEILIATASADIIGLLLILWMDLRRASHYVKTLAIFLASAVLPIAAAFVLLSTSLTAGDALHGVLGAWPATLGGIGGATEFYRAWAGLENFPYHLRSTLLWFGAYLAIFLPIAAIGLAFRRRGKLRQFVAVAVFLAAIVLLGVTGRSVDWRGVARPFPLILLLIGASTFVTLLRGRGRVERTRPLISVLMLTVFAMALLLKLGFYSRIFFYGWALGMPAAMLLIVALVDWLPRLIDRRGGYGQITRAASLGVLLVVVIVHLGTIAEPLRSMTYRVGTGADSFWGDRRAQTAVNALEAIEDVIKPDETFAVMPEGVMLNYLSRRSNPTPYYAFIPLETILYGEETMIAALAEHPPDFLLFAHRPTPEHGPDWAYFTATYGRKLGAWMDRHYEGMVRIEDPERVDESFGWIVLLERLDRIKDGSGTSSPRSSTD